jgi:hypothetical protein
VLALEEKASTAVGKRPGFAAILEIFKSKKLKASQSTQALLDLSKLASVTD